ncbi:MAG: hypothetical protein SFT90_05535 [Rickettsiales bacterium]|nr:hypothetical protein [Rickettsiales bacterium]
MLTILSSFIGFISSVIPDLLKQIQDRRDKKHEVEILKLQMENARAGHKEKLDVIEVNSGLEEAKIIYQNQNSGVRFIDGLNASVRPIIAYGFFILYCMVKYFQVQGGLVWQIWQEEDQAIFAGIISFYFGSRAMQKLRNR